MEIVFAPIAIFVAYAVFRLDFLKKEINDYRNRVRRFFVADKNDADVQGEENKKQIQWIVDSGINYRDEKYEQISHEVFIEETRVSLETIKDKFTGFSSNTLYLVWGDKKFSLGRSFSRLENLVDSWSIISNILVTSFWLLGILVIWFLNKQVEQAHLLAVAITLVVVVVSLISKDIKSN